MLSICPFYDIPMWLFLYSIRNCILVNVATAKSNSLTKWIAFHRKHSFHISLIGVVDWAKPFFSCWFVILFSQKYCWLMCVFSNPSCVKTSLWWANLKCQRNRNGFHCWNEFPEFRQMANCWNGWIHFQKYLAAKRIRMLWDSMGEYAIDWDRWKKIREIHTHKKTRAICFDVNSIWFNVNWNWNFNAISNILHWVSLRILPAVHLLLFVHVNMERGWFFYRIRGFCSMKTVTKHLHSSCSSIIYIGSWINRLISSDYFASSP